jgi:hypothetical protein
MLLEVSPDKTRCKVAVRDRALIVHKPWVDCRWVHDERGESAASPARAGGRSGTGRADRASCRTA